MDYLYWHFAVAPFEILRIMKNYQVASWYKFLITQHFRTLFSPWHRQNPSDFGPRSRTFGDKILDAITDLYIRLIAACVRLTIIFAGLLFQVFVLVAFVVLFVTWLAWPAIAIFLILKGFNIVTHGF